MNDIHPSAIIESGAEIGANTTVGPFSIVYSNANIGADSSIGAYCEIGLPTPLANSSDLLIGPNSIIRSRTTLYQGSSFSGLRTGHGVTIRENVVAGKDLQVGTLSDLQGDSKFGDYVRLHSNVHIGKLSVIGNYVWIFPYVVMTNDPTPPSDEHLGASICDFAIVATMSVLLPGVKVGRHALVGAHSCVTKDVPEGMCVAGVPARVVAACTEIKLRSSGQSAYPWPTRFSRGYPDEVVAAFRGLVEEDAFGDV